MALFKGTDENLPLLTQFYQIDVPDEWAADASLLEDSELERWWNAQSFVEFTELLYGDDPSFQSLLVGRAIRV